MAKPIIPYDIPNVIVKTDVVNNAISLPINTNLLFSSPSNWEVKIRLRVMGITAKLIILMASTASEYFGNISVLHIYMSILHISLL